jgi:hypothetical protein
MEHLRRRLTIIAIAMAFTLAAGTLGFVLIDHYLGYGAAEELRAPAHSARRGTVRSPESLTPRRAGPRCALSQWRSSGGDHLIAMGEPQSLRRLEQLVKGVAA